jgi:DNA polymerase III delta subunit
MVIVFSPEELLKKDGSKERALARAIPKFMAANAGCVVLVADGLRADNATVKAILAAGGSLLSFRKLYDKPAPWERFPDARRTEVSEWTLARAKAKGLKISADQVVLLIAAVGGDLCVLENKLTEFQHTPGQEFFQRLDASAPVSPFDLAQALARGDLRAALHDCEGLFHAGYKSKDGKLEVKPDALREILFSGLRSQVRRGVAAGEALRSGSSPEEAAKAAGVSAFQMRDFLGALSAREPDAWRAMASDLARLERKARSGHTVDVNDLAMFALRWRKPKSAVQR